MFPLLFRSTMRQPPRMTMAAFRYFSSDMQNGVVKWFDAKKGFGFIVPENGGEEVFVHQTAIHAQGFRSLADGEPVEFTAFTDERGRLKAQRVTGPMGSFVQGAPRRSFGRALGGGPPADAGFGISGSSPFGNSGFGDTSTTFGNADAVPQMPAMDAPTPETTTTTAASEDASSSLPSEDAEKKEESTTTSSTTSTTTTTV